MAKHITRWRPDTCTCVLEFEWDDAVPEAERTHTPVKVERCAAHTNAGPQHQHVFDEVLAENRHKNEVRLHLLETLGDEHVSVFEFDENRELRVTFPGAPAEVRTAAQAALQARAFSRAVGVN